MMLLSRPLTRVIPLLAACALTPLVLTAQRVDRIAALDAQIGRIFDSREYEVPRFGPARWLPDGSGYTTVERSKEDGWDIIRYDARSGARSVLVAATRLVPKGEKA